TQIVDNVFGIYDGCLRRALLHVPQSARRWLFHPDAPPSQPSLGDSFEDPADAIHWPGIIEVRLVVFHPPELHLIRFKPWNEQHGLDRKSTRLNSSHVAIS